MIKKEKILLIGYRATGKSSIGKLLASKINFSFIDLDDFITQKVGMTIKEMVEKYGWEYFRKQEKKALKDILEKRKTVIACGGGAVIHESEFKVLKESSFIIWLKAQPKTILERIRQDPNSSENRPSLTPKDLRQEIETLLQEREPLYASFAHWSLTTDNKKIEEIVKLIIEHMGGGNVSTSARDLT